MRFAVNGAQPLFTLGLSMFALSLADSPSFLWAPVPTFKCFTFVKSIIWRNHTKSSKKIHVGLKLEWGFKVFLSCRLMSYWEYLMQTCWLQLSDHWSVHRTSPRLPRFMWYGGLKAHWSYVGYVCLISYPFPNLSDAVGEFWEWKSNFIPHFIGYLITNPWWVKVNSW